MDFTLKIMGTASAMPVSDRKQSAQVLRIHGRSFLIDCGEGVQGQMVSLGESIMKLDSIFISHIHGDHVFGIFGLLSTLGMLGRTAPVNIYAPSNFGPILKFFLSYYGEGIPFEARYFPLSGKEPETICSTKATEVVAFPLNHKIATYGFLFREKEPQLNVRKEAIAKYDLNWTEIGSLKRGEDVERPGMTIPVEAAAYKPFKPRSYAYVSDTAPFPELPGWVSGVDILYHEATYTSEYADQAALRHHSTALQAAECALRAGAGKLVIGHYSSRCRDASLYEAEARTVFPETYAASDGDIFDIPLVKFGD